MKRMVNTIYLNGHEYNSLRNAGISSIPGIIFKPIQNQGMGMRKPIYLSQYEFASLKRAGITNIPGVEVRVQSGMQGMKMQKMPANKVVHVSLKEYQELKKKGLDKIIVSSMEFKPLISKTIEISSAEHASLQKAGALNIPGLNFKLKESKKKRR